MPFPFTKTWRDLMRVCEFSWGVSLGYAGVVFHGQDPNDVIPIALMIGFLEHGSLVAVLGLHQQQQVSTVLRQPLSLILFDLFVLFGKNSPLFFLPLKSLNKKILHLSCPLLLISPDFSFGIRWRTLRRLHSSPCRPLSRYPVSISAVHSKLVQSTCSLVAKVGEYIVRNHVN